MPSNSNQSGNSNQSRQAANQQASQQTSQAASQDGSNQEGDNPGGNPASKRPAHADFFEVEIGDSCNRSVHLSSIKVNLRGKFSVSNITSREGGGRQIGEALLNMPDIPGMRVKVDLTNGAYTIYDPLNNNPMLLDRINGIADKVPILRGPKVKPVETINAHEQDPDRFKTLVLQLIRLVNDGMGKVTDGLMPKEESLEALPGRELFDPNSNSHAKPRYVKDYYKWSQEIDKAVK